MDKAHTPCYGCTDRNERCHAVCEKYKDYADKAEQLREERYKFKTKQVEITNHFIDAKRKAGRWKK